MTNIQDHPKKVDANDFLALRSRQVDFQLHLLPSFLRLNFELSDCHPLKFLEKTLQIALRQSKYRFT